MSPELINENLSAIVARIDAARKAALKPAPATTLVAVTKTQAGEAIYPALTMPAASGGISGSRPIARLTLKGVAKGTGSVSLDASAMTLVTGGPAIVSASSAQVEVK